MLPLCLTPVESKGKFWTQPAATRVCNSPASARQQEQPATTRERNILTKTRLLTVAALFLTACAVALAQAPAQPGTPGTLTRLAHSAPDNNETAFLLTDGTVLVQGFNDSDWYRFTPDINGSYLNGTWTRVADLPAGYSPYAYASAVL